MGAGSYSMRRPPKRHFLDRPQTKIQNIAIGKTLVYPDIYNIKINGPAAQQDGLERRCWPSSRATHRTWMNFAANWANLSLVLRSLEEAEFIYTSRRSASWIGRSARRSDQGSTQSSTSTVKDRSEYSVNAQDSMVSSATTRAPTTLPAQKRVTLDPD